MHKNFENKSLFSNLPSCSSTRAEKLNCIELKVLINKRFLITEVIYLHFPQIFRLYMYYCNTLFY